MFYDVVRECLLGISIEHCGQWGAMHGVHRVDIYEMTIISDRKEDTVGTLIAYCVGMEFRDSLKSIFFR